MDTLTALATSHAHNQAQPFILNPPNSEGDAHIHDLTHATGVFAPRGRLPSPPPSLCAPDPSHTPDSSQNTHEAAANDSQLDAARKLAASSLPALPLLVPVSSSTVKERVAESTDTAAPPKAAASLLSFSDLLTWIQQDCWANPGSDANVLLRLCTIERVLFSRCASIDLNEMKEMTCRTRSSAEMSMLLHVLQHTRTNTPAH